ncbi:MAG: 2-dehydro-3-deoxyphosphogalactonate aldolase, partial [uncultured Acetobacteraceae bacterium]
ERPCRLARTQPPGRHPARADAGGRGAGGRGAGGGGHHGHRGAAELPRADGEHRAPGRPLRRRCADRRRHRHDGSAGRGGGGRGRQAAGDAARRPGAGARRQGAGDAGGPGLLHAGRSLLLVGRRGGRAEAVPGRGRLARRGEGAAGGAAARHGAAAGGRHVGGHDRPLAEGGRRRIRHRRLALQAGGQAGGGGAAGAGAGRRPGWRL